MKISITGNCQATPLSELFNQINFVKKVDTFILHLSDKDSFADDISLLKDADLIIAQKTNANFEPMHLNSHWLKDKFKEKVIIWPNIFFMGQQPYIRYITSSQGRLKGPLDDYHDIRLLLDWLKFKKLIDEEMNFSERSTKENILISLNTLKTKENDCDVIVSDVIEEHINKKVLFFSFNHPSSFLLKELFKRLIDKISQTQGQATNIDFSKMAFQKGEPLSTYIMPSAWPIDTIHKKYRGLNLDMTKETSRFIDYDENTLRKAFFDYYNVHFFNSIDLETIRLTPVVKHDQSIIDKLKKAET